MAYCDRCGSYIPDGWTVCPACGYDKEQEEKQTQQAAQAQAYQQQQEKYAREEAEKRRAQRQAYDKVWAENEQRRRKEEEEFRRRQKEQEERVRREQEERARREKDEGGVQVFVDADGRKNIKVGDRIHVVVNPDGSKKVQVDGKTHEYSDSDRNFDVDFGKAGEKVRDFLNSDAVNKAEETFSNAGGKILPLLSYLGPLCFIPLILGNNDFTHFHAKQGLRLFITGAVLTGIGSLFSIGFAVGIFQLLMSILGVKNVLNGEKKKLPYIGG